MKNIRPLCGLCGISVAYCMVENSGLVSTMLAKPAFSGEPMRHPADPEPEELAERFQTPDGLEVILDPATWSQHIQARHAEVTKDELRHTLVTPQRICAHTSNPGRRIYEGTPRRSGFFRHSFLIVVVALSDERSGRVLTALSRSASLPRATTMASINESLTLQYDAEGDVLYASLGPPQAAVSYEVSADVLLRYVPPSRRVVGITIIDFTRHYTVAEGNSVEDRARAIIEALLAQFPELPASLGRPAPSPQAP
jgi:uncharacterized protein YuzE